MLKMLYSLGKDLHYSQGLRPWSLFSRAQFQLWLFPANQLWWKHVSRTLGFSPNRVLSFICSLTSVIQHPIAVVSKEITKCKSKSKIGHHILSLFLVELPFLLYNHRSETYHASECLCNLFFSHISYVFWGAKDTKTLQFILLACSIL